MINSRIMRVFCARPEAFPVSPETPLGRVDEVVAKVVGLTRSTFQRGDAILIQYPEVFENDIKKAGMEIGEVQRKIKRQEKRNELVQEALNNPKIELPEGIQLIHGDFIEKSKEIPDESIDMIFTDPP